VPLIFAVSYCILCILWVLFALFFYFSYRLRWLKLCIMYIQQVWLEIAFCAPFGGVLGGHCPLNEFRHCRNRQNDVLWRKHVVWAISYENQSTGLTLVRAGVNEIQYNKQKSQKKHNISPIWGEENSLSENSVNCNTVNTFKKCIATELEPETTSR